MSVDHETLVVTRRSLHAVAESVIAGPQYRRFGTIRLAQRPGGFGGIALAVAVVGTELEADGERVGLSGTTCRRLAEVAGLDVGPPVGLYTDGSDLEVDDELVVDPEAAASLAEWYATGDQALRRLAPGAEPVLWPEHFDLAVSLDDATFGVSPGDQYSVEPYAYVSVAEPPVGDLWNAPFGALWRPGVPGGPPDLDAFFDQARRELTSRR
jgi:hypothetical protein